MTEPRGISINLIGYKIEEKREKRRRILFFAVSVLLALFLLGGIGLEAKVKHQEAKALKQGIQELQIELQGIDLHSSDHETIDALIQELELRENLVEEIEKEQISYADPLQDLLKADIAGILITNITVKQDSIVFSGYSQHHEALVKLLQCFEQSPYFKEISDLRYQLDEESGELSFSITAGLEVQKP